MQEAKQQPQKIEEPAKQEEKDKPTTESKGNCGGDL